MSLKTELRDFINGFFDNAGYSQSGFFSYSHSNAGVDVNETSSMTVGAVAACQRIISSAVASLGCYVYEQLPDGGHRLAEDHPYFPLVSLSPSPDYPAVDFFATGQVHLLQNGNAFAEIIRNGGGQAVEFVLRSPFRTHIERNPQTGEILYRTTDTPNGAQRIIAAYDMVHPKNMGTNPFFGLSPIRLYMREVIGTALAAQAYGAKLFKNDARPGGYLASKKVVKDEEKLRQIQSWVAGHSGTNNHMVAFLDGETTWEKVGINPDEAQFLQTRQFQRSEIASIYGVPAHMLGNPEETKATIEQKALEFLIWTVKPWLRRWEHALNVKLFPVSKEKRPGPKQPRYFIKFDTSEYERSDYATTLKGIQTGRYSGLYTLNEGRKLLGLNPVTDDNFDETQPGKSLWRPVNMAIAGEDPAKFSSGGAGASPDAPEQDQPAPTDDGGDNSRMSTYYLGRFDAKLDQLEALSKPTFEVWERIMLPVFVGLAGHNSNLVTIAARGVITSMHHNGVKVCREQSKQILNDFTATVRAISHPEETPCE